MIPWLLSLAFAQSPEPAPAPESPATEPAPAPTTTDPAPEAPAPEPEAAVPPPRRSGVVDRIVATVNDDVITLSDVYELGADYTAKKCPDGGERCVTEAELEVLDSLVRRTLIQQELTRLELDVTAAEVDQAIDATVRQYQLADRAALRASVEASGKRWDQYRDELEEYMRQQTFQARVLAPRVSVSEDELRDLYQRTARKVKTPVAKVSGLGIGIPDGTPPEDEAKIVEQAQQLVDALNKGEIPWDDAVKQYDAGASRMFAGTEFTPTSIIEPLADVVFNAPVGAVQPPVRVPMGNGVDVLFVLRVDEKGERSEVAPYDEIVDQLREEVFRAKLQEAEEEWYQRARREAAVDVKLVVPS